MATWTTIMLRLNGDEGKDYDVSLNNIAAIPIPAIKEMVVEKLKAGYGDLFSEALWGYVTLYHDQARSVEITDKKMPEGEEFYAKLKVPDATKGSIKGVADREEKHRRTRVMSSKFQKASLW